MPASDGYATEIGQLEAALSSGEAQIKGADGKMVVYRTADEIRSAIGYFKAAASSAVPSASGKTTYATWGGYQREGSGGGWGCR